MIQMSLKLVTFFCTIEKLNGLGLIWIFVETSFFPPSCWYRTLGLFNNTWSNCTLSQSFPAKWSSIFKTLSCFPVFINIRVSWFSKNWQIIWSKKYVIIYGKIMHYLNLQSYPSIQKLHLKYTMEILKNTKKDIVQSFFSGFLPKNHFLCNLSWLVLTVLLTLWTLFMYIISYGVCHCAISVMYAIYVV